jgi:hypothetical protein
MLKIVELIVTPQNNDTAFFKPSTTVATTKHNRKIGEGEAKPQFRNKKKKLNNFRNQQSNT